MKKLNRLVAKIGDNLQSLTLLVIRLYFGWQFATIGWGKLTHLAKTTDYFASLNLPMPHLQAIAAGSVECFGGSLLLLGLCARLVSVPLMFTMIVAYLTAERPALHAIFSDPDKFTSATPFLFLSAALLVFVFGPGKVSLDALICQKSASE
jgi:putative oxidoreductase